MAQAAAELDTEAQYVDHPEMAAIAADLIRRHERFEIVTGDLRIGYRSRLGPPSGEGEALVAACQKAPPLWHDETGLDIVIWVWDAVWDELEPRQREALVSHELCHIGRNKTGGVKLRKHDLEEFAWVARQYGRWDDAISHFGAALQLHDDEAAAKVTPIRRPAGRERRRPGSRSEAKS